MILNRLFRKIAVNKHLNVCLLCSQPVKTDAEHQAEDLRESENKKKRKRRSKKRVLELEQFFHDNPEIQIYEKLIPENLLYFTPYNKPEYMYLICPNTAKKVANHMLPSLHLNKDHIVAEANPGFGFITRELLKRGVPIVRLYEKDTEFQKIIKNGDDNDISYLQIFDKDFFKLHLYSHVDRFDQENRVASLLEGVPKKSWVDDAVMTIVGTMTNLNFIKYLITSIVFQKEIATYGRIEIFALTFPRNWGTLNSTMQGSGFTYRSWTVLFQIFFEVKLLDKFPRKFFLPWQTQSNSQKRNTCDFDKDYIYLLQISMRKNFSLSAEEFVPFFCFIRTFLVSGSKLVIPTCEKWVPECGINLLLPKGKHENYFDDMDIFTQFKELTPEQIVAVFKEITSMPEYHESPFMDMIEQELIKSETISSDLHAIHNKRKTTESDLELK